MRFQERVHSSFWDTLIFEDEELNVFFPERKSPFYRLKNDKIQFIEPNIRILRQDVYEWCLDQFGPEFNMDNPCDRVYYNFADVPDLTKPNIKKLRETRCFTQRWCVADQRAIAFRDSKDAMLFKLIWCASGTP